MDYACSTGPAKMGGSGSCGFLLIGAALAHAFVSPAARAGFFSDWLPAMIVAGLPSAVLRRQLPWRCFRARLTALPAFAAGDARQEPPPGAAAGCR
jgi:hypothetical protein